jgi:hypothetical protein
MRVVADVPRAIRHPFFDTLLRAPETRQLGKLRRRGLVLTVDAPSKQHLLKSLAITCSSVVAFARLWNKNNRSSARHVIRKVPAMTYAGSLRYVMELAAHTVALAYEDAATIGCLSG